MPLPESLSKFEKQGQKLFLSGAVGDIEFSGGTYQIRVYDALLNFDAWTFFQFDPLGGLQDHFCSCEQGDEFIGCAHLAAAMLGIYHGHRRPIHIRFLESLFHLLARSYADKFGCDPAVLVKVSESKYAIDPYFSLEFFDGSLQKQLVEERVKETDETSLKFSNLPEEEINRWREGRPSFRLSYELSFWNDLAKWMMITNEYHESANISFGFAENGLPDRVAIGFKGLVVSFFLPEKLLVKIIPSLAKVRSPLKVVYPQKEEVQRISYDEKTGSLLLQKALKGKKGENRNHAGISLGGWSYVKNEGFYATIDQEALEGVIPEQAVSEFIEDHIELLEKVPSDIVFHFKRRYLNYEVSFDRNYTLHVTSFLEEPGDLKAANTRLFGNWIYVPGRGFFAIDKPPFQALILEIPQEDVAEFVREHRIFFNAVSGFTIHLTDVEAHLTYKVDENRRLSFYRQKIEGESGTKDFGSLVYIEQEGFYPKAPGRGALTLHPGIKIEGEEIPSFIRMHAGELKAIPGFFSLHCPVKRAKVVLRLDEDGAIEITPKFEVKEEYEQKDVVLFGDYSFVPSEGFCKLPPECQLPDRYSKPCHIPREGIEEFLVSELPLVRSPMELDPRLTRPKQASLEALKIIPREGGVSAQLAFQTEFGKVYLAELFDRHKRKERFCFTEAGLIDLNDSRFAWISLFDKKSLRKGAKSLLLTSAEVLKVHALSPISVPSFNTPTIEKTREVLSELVDFTPPPPPDLTGLKSVLRPYQQLGVEWLWFLWAHGLSGLLCDDMGLGKTHQAMGLVAAIKNKTGRKGEVLIVSPTSVLYHWEEKLAEFLPGFKVCVFHGLKRELAEDHDIILTSYGILRKEKKLLSSFRFDLAILDELQIAKNASSQTHSALLSLKSKMMLGMTGTPIENDLRELKSLFDIVLPGYMPPDRIFQDYFSRPIEKEQDIEKRKILSRLIFPFILRRKKEEVLKDLPEKIEEVAHCDLKPSQKVLYDDVLHQSREKLIRSLEDDANPIPYMHIFALLSKLKQICDHPAAYWKVPDYYKDYESGKWELFVEYLHEALNSEQKVVVFSHYLAMLDIIENYLKDSKVGFAGIRGSTRERKEEVFRFNHDSKCKVFVASLQAAGLGIDLTAGSVVIHYDRWWNAARERQATDRVHRIGQLKGVQVFKLVTKSTLEERIDEIIMRKGKLMDEIVTADDHRILKTFTRSDMIELLRGIG